MPKKGSKMALGKAIENDRRRKVDQMDKNAALVTGVAQSQNARSVLEQTSLDEFLASAALARATFESTRGAAHAAVDTGAQLITVAASDLDAEAREAIARNVVVPIPWRPKWKEGMTPEELGVMEGEQFLEWRRSLARLEEEESLVMTPYERNLDFWRQLWRCVERSDLLVQILDVRDPEFYRSKDLERYVGSFKGKRHLLLLNKSDFLTVEHRQMWESHLASQGVDAIFFSALRELHRQQKLTSAFDDDEDDDEDADDEEKSAESRLAQVKEEAEEARQKLSPHGDLSDASELLDCNGLLEELRKRLPEVDGHRRGTVGFVGYPNVGKSSVINALFGAKKVSMSRTPGKTKHLQTLELPDITLCDCPGLVMPSVVSTKAHLVINGTVPIDELRDFIAPARLIVDKVGSEHILKKYGVSQDIVKDGAIRRGAVSDSAHLVLCGLAVARHHFLRVGVPDETWAARKLLRDFCSGALLYCRLPPGHAATKTEASEPSASQDPAQDSNGEDDFDDVGDFLQSEDGKSSARMTKRKERFLMKQMMKGTGMPLAPTPSGSIRHPKACLGGMGG